MKMGMLVTLALFTMCFASESAFAAYEYRCGSGISGTSIKKSKDMQWFHISESCTLKAKGTDKDERRELPCGAWEEMEDDFIDWENCSWSGTGIQEGAKGQTTSWTVNAPTGESGVTVTANIVDYTNNPHADANDSNAQATKQMYAYQAVAYLNCTSSNSGSPSKTVYEVGGSQQQCTLSMAEATVSCGGDDTKTIEAWGTSTWRLDTSPANASLGSTGQLKAPISVNASGTLDGKVGDNDINDGSFSVGVELGGGAGVEASVSIEFPIQMDSVEGSVGAGFAFSSDHLGDDTDDELEMISGDDPDPLFEFYYDIQSANYSKSGSATFRGGKTSESKSKALIEGTAKTVGEAVSTCADLGSTGNVVYTVCVPGYEPGQAPGPEEGY